MLTASILPAKTIPVFRDEIMVFVCAVLDATRLIAVTRSADVVARAALLAANSIGIAGVSVAVLTTTTLLASSAAELVRLAEVTLVTEAIDAFRATTDEVRLAEMELVIAATEEARTIADAVTLAEALESPETLAARSMLVLRAAAAIAIEATEVSAFICVERAAPVTTTPAVANALILISVVRPADKT